MEKMHLWPEPQKLENNHIFKEAYAPSFEDMLWRAIDRKNI